MRKKDPKGLYAKTQRGEMREFTGLITDPVETSVKRML
ncbi:adenylyl-sulfate kinase [Desulfitobacterium sp. Sab5]